MSPLIPMVIEQTSRGERGLRHLLAPAERADHLPRHPDRRPDRQPRRRASSSISESEEPDKDISSTSTPRAARSTPVSPSTTRFSSSSRTCRRSASASRCRWALCSSAAVRRKRMSLPNAKILIHQVSSGFQGQADIEIQARKVISISAAWRRSSRSTPDSRSRRFHRTWSATTS